MGDSTPSENISDISANVSKGILVNRFSPLIFIRIFLFFSVFKIISYISLFTTILTFLSSYFCSFLLKSLKFTMTQSSVRNSGSEILYILDSWVFTSIRTTSPLSPISASSYLETRLNTETSKRSLMCRMCWTRY